MRKKESKVTLRMKSPSLGTLVWELPPNVPRAELTAIDQESIGMLLKPHMTWFLTVLIAGLVQKNKTSRWFAKLQETEDRHKLETLEITLS